MGHGGRPCDAWPGAPHRPTPWAWLAPHERGQEGSMAAAAGDRGAAETVDGAPPTVVFVAENGWGGWIGNPQGG